MAVSFQPLFYIFVKFESYITVDAETGYLSVYAKCVENINLSDFAVLGSSLLDKSPTEAIYTRCNP